MTNYDLQTVGGIGSSDAGVSSLKSMPRKWLMALLIAPAEIRDRVPVTPVSKTPALALHVCELLGNKQISVAYLALHRSCARHALEIAGSAVSMSSSDARCDSNFREYFVSRNHTPVCSPVTHSSSTLSI